MDQDVIELTFILFEDSENKNLKDSNLLLILENLDEREIIVTQ